MDNETLSSLIKACRQAGLRNTTVLRAVLSTLGEHGGAWNVADITQQIAVTSDIKPNAATIYRIVGRLEEAGIIRRVALPFREGYYTLNEEQGDNSFFVVIPGSEQKFQCVGVGVGDTNLKAIAQLCNEAAAESGQEIVRCEIVFYAKPDAGATADDGKTVYTA